MSGHEHNQDHLLHLESLLKIQYDKLFEHQKEVSFATSADERIARRLRIKHEILPELLKLEVDYGEALAGAVNPDDLPTEQINLLLGDLTKAIDKLNQTLPNTANDEIREKLEEVIGLLAKPGRSASAKLKTLLPIVPFLLVYELELDTENTLKDVWRSVKKLFRSKASANHSKGLNPAKDTADTEGMVFSTHDDESTEKDQKAHDIHTPTKPDNSKPDGYINKLKTVRPRRHANPPKVFISYCREDKDWKDRVVKHLKVLEMARHFEVWTDTVIPAGDDWEPAIKQAMSECKIALFLISKDFLTSKYITGTEVPMLLKRRIEAGVRVIPVIVKPCAWQSLGWLKPINARPTDGKPLSGMTDHDAEQSLADLTAEIDVLLSQFTNPR